MSMAEGSTVPAQSRNCHSDCKTCPDLKIHELIKSSATSRVYQPINDTNKRITCKLQNYVYVLTCKSCFVQYVGKSVTPLHKRINIHRKGKSGCEIIKFVQILLFFIQILEVLPGDGYKNGDLDTEMTSHRLAREDFWMKTLRTIYLYGLCDKYKRDPKVHKDAPVSKLFPALPRYGNDFLVSILAREMDLETSMIIQISPIYLKPISTNSSRDFNLTLAQTPFVNILTN